MTKKILIIDDDATTRHLLKKRLSKSEEYNVLTAENGDVGLQLARQDHPDVILLDVMMPAKSGGEVARLLKEDEITKHIPIVFMTVLLDAGGHKRFEINDQEFRAVAKPVYLPELLAQIRKAINESRHTD